MSTPNPALVSAAPVLDTALGYVEEAVTTIFTGDPAQIGLRAGPAIAILDNKLLLLAPQLMTAEEAVVLADALKQLGSIRSKIQALIPKA